MVKSVKLCHRDKFHWNRFDRGWDTAIFWFFKMAAAAILDFWSFIFLLVRTVKRVKLHHDAKFCQNCSNHGQDMTISLFFQDGGRPPSWISDVCVSTTHKGHLLVFITVHNLVGIDALVLIICTFFDFARLVWKSLLMLQNWGFGDFGPPQVNKCQKRHPCTSPRRLSHHAWKSVDGSVGEFPKRCINENNFGYISPMCPEAPRRRMCT